jgi:hypothetical protein
VIDAGCRDLTKVIRTLRASARFARCLDRRQQERDKNSDDRNDDEQLNQREADAAPTIRQ